MLCLGGQNPQHGAAGASVKCEPYKQPLGAHQRHPAEHNADWRCSPVAALPAAHLQAFARSCVPVCGVIAGEAGCGVAVAVGTAPDGALLAGAVHKAVAVRAGRAHFRIIVAVGAVLDCALLAGAIHKPVAGPAGCAHCGIALAVVAVINGALLAGAIHKAAAGRAGCAHCGIAVARDAFGVCHLALHALAGNHAIPVHGRWAGRAGWHGSGHTRACSSANASSGSITAQRGVAGSAAQRVPFGRALGQLT